MSFHLHTELLFVVRESPVFKESIQIKREVNAYHACCPDGSLSWHMPLHIWDNITGSMTVADLVAYGGTSKANYDAMHQIIQKRIASIFKRFRLPYKAFYDMLRGQYAVVSGSVALYVFDPAGGWEPEDLDIYVARKRARRVVNRLRSMNYVPAGDRRKIGGYGDNRAVYSVTTLTNGDRSIDVVESATWVPIQPIFSFHSSIIMNYISHEGFFSAYPCLTTRRQGFKHGAMQVAGELEEAYEGCFEKYELRGYKLGTTSMEWDAKEGAMHLCGSTWHCPLTVRHTFDPGCLFAPFESSVGKLKERTSPVSRCFGHKRAVVWCAAGPTCDGTVEPLRHFVSVDGAQSQFN